MGLKIYISKYLNIHIFLQLKINRNCWNFKVNNLLKDIIGGLQREIGVQCLIK